METPAGAGQFLLIKPAHPMVLMTPREFAIEVTRQLQQAGFQALFAGGCVRDALLGRKPKDYDVATDATPDRVRDLFGKRKTIAIGAAFGVITVIGPRSAGQIEVATFRRDGNYGDGRRPDRVEFTDAREDAIRRDFTVNGMFFDPVSEEVIDFVGGREDLKAEVIRAIGDPHQRIEEDKLRMLRAIRFAANYRFEIDPETMEAIRQRTEEIKVVSPERIGAELRKTLQGDACERGLRLLRDSLLWPVVFPLSGFPGNGDTGNVETILTTVARLKLKEFPVVAAAVLIGIDPELALQPDVKRNDQQRLTDAVNQLKDAWRLTNDERDEIHWLCSHVRRLIAADKIAWPDVQPVLVKPGATRGLALADAIEPGSDGTAFCRERLQWPDAKLNPPALLDGRDLIELGIRPGPDFSRALDAVRRLQLEGEIETREQALDRVSGEFGGTKE